MHAYVGALDYKWYYCAKLLFLFPQKISIKNSEKNSLKQIVNFTLNKKKFSFLVLKFDTICLKETLGVRQPSILPL